MCPGTREKPLSFASWLHQCSGRWVKKNPWKRVNKLSSPCHSQSRRSEDHLSLKGLPSALSWQTEVALFLLPLRKFMRIIWDWIRISWAPSKHSISNLPTLTILTFLVAYPSLWIYAGTEHENNTVFPQQPRIRKTCQCHSSSRPGQLDFLLRMSLDQMLLRFLPRAKTLWFDGILTQHNTQILRALHYNWLPSFPLSSSKQSWTMRFR